jgi:internalin A
MSETALELIQKAKAEGSKELDLSGQNLTSLPEELAQLTQLETLRLGLNLSTFRRNFLTALPDWLANLTNLQYLQLSSNKLTALPDWLAKLTNLQYLNLNHNQLTALPDWLANLTNLQSLHLSSNKLTALPGWLANLTNLQSLQLSSNKLTALPDWLAKLTNLQYLQLSSNKLTALPDWLANLTNLLYLFLNENQLAALPDWLANLTNLLYLDLSENQLTALPDWLADPTSLPRLSALYVYGNPLSVPPPETLGDALTEISPAPIDAIRSYFRQLRAGATNYLYEAKLLIIGEGGAGKTSLARKLANPRCELLPDQKSTEGIEIIHWNFPVPPALAPDHKKNEYTAKIWDFGGQEIYFATHQFFLTKRSVYLLVADTRRHHTDFYTWLLMQETFGGDSPVLLIKNRNRRHGNSFHIENILQLRERFPNLQEPLEVDLNEAPGGAGWSKLLQSIQERLLALPHIQQPRPGTWVAVRRAVREEARSIIPSRDFFQLCRDHGIQYNQDINHLGEYMHNLGDILYFHEDRVLRNYVILKPRWGLDAVYKVLDNRQIEENLGKFSHDDLRILWGDPEHQDYHNELLRLMENFQLCYELPDQKDTYIAPQLLDEVVPVYDWDPSENLQLRYEYPVFMPRGILSRAIVKLHKNIEDQRLVWRSGVVLHDQYARAELLELRTDKQIRIRVSGRNKRDLLMQIVRTLDELHRGFPTLQFNKLVPCNCPACIKQTQPYFFNFDALLERLAHRKRTIECNKPPYETVDIQGLLSETGIWDPRMENRGRLNPDFLYDLEDPHRGISLNPATSPQGAIRGKLTHAKKPAEHPATREQVFISYCQKDKKFFDELITHLAPLERAGLVTTWSDTKIEPGAQSLDAIRAALATAKVAVLLVSRDFLASEAIQDHELGPLLQKAEDEGVRLLWVPVGASTVNDTPISRYKAVILPDKPLADMKPSARDKALVQICEEIKKAVSAG